MIIRHNTSVASTAINAASAYIRAFVPHSGSSTLGTQAATVIGNTYWTSLQSIVSSLYSGALLASRDRIMNRYITAELVQQMKLFQACVHAGNANALAIGPCPVDYYGQQLDNISCCWGRVITATKLVFTPITVLTVISTWDVPLFLPLPKCLLSMASTQNLYGIPSLSAS